MAVQELQGLSRSDVVPSTLAARDQGRQQWWLELVVCTPSAAGACVVAGAGRQTHTCSGGGHSRQAETIYIAYNSSSSDYIAYKA